MSKIDGTHKIDLTPEQMRQIARYELTFREILPESDADDIYVDGKAGYCYLLEDLVTALHNLQADNPTVADFEAYWLHPIMCLGEVFHLDEARGLQTGIDDTPEGRREFEGLPISDSWYFDEIWNILEAVWAEYEDDTLLEDIIEFDRIYEDLARYASNKGKPIEEMIFSKEQMRDYIWFFEDDEQVSEASEKELALCRKFIEELIKEDDHLALYIKGYACYGGNRMYPCDWHASRDCITRLYELTDDPQYPNTLGYIYYYGRCTGGVPDYDKAFRYFEIAAANGLYEGMYKLADMYWHGYGCKKSPRTAYTLYRMVYENCLEHYLIDEEGSFADAALRMGNVFAKGIHVEKDPRMAYFYYLQADYAAKRRAKESDFFGNTTVVINIQKALEETKAEIPDTYFGDHFDDSTLWLFERLAADRFPCKLDRKREEDGQWALTASRIASQACPHPDSILVTIPQIGLCERTIEVTLHTVNAENIWFSGDTDCIRYDYCQWDNVEGRFEFYFDDELAAWIKCERFRVLAKAPEAAHGPEYRLVSIRFNPKGRSYDYLCDFEDVQVGDMVVVEGYDGETEVEVTDIRTKRESELGLPVERYKRIVRKA